MSRHSSPIPSRTADGGRHPDSVQRAASAPQADPIPQPDMILADLLARTAMADAEGPGVLNGPDGADGLLTDLLGPEVEEARRARREETTRLAAYLDDLAAVLRTQGGVGVRVLRHWLDAACANDRLSRPEPAIHGAAALYDYARDRTAEIAMADPASLLRIQLEGARRWAGEQLNTGGRRD
ncbi:hypothetical protein [Nitratidesulfovibrio sp.]|uniref:hypothetical protein n=1 Tax=Nitratidesulfovibrio sp. TaxID=2802297 RepID=UPI00333F29DC